MFKSIDAEQRKALLFALGGVVLLLIGFAVFHKKALTGAVVAPGAAASSTTGTPTDTTGAPNYTAGDTTYNSYAVNNTSAAAPPGAVARGVVDQGVGVLYMPGVNTPASGPWAG